jgi:hypothetical protein
MDIRAVKNLYPNAAVMIKDEEIISLDGTEFDMELIVQENAKLQYQEEINEYKDQRSREYPPYTDYLDGLVKGDQDQMDAYIAACQVVKDKYPKTEMDDDELATRQSQALFDYQLKIYTDARISRDHMLSTDPNADVSEYTDIINSIPQDVINHYNANN